MQTKLLTVSISVQLWALGVALPPNAEALPVPQAAAQDQSGIATLPVLALDHHGTPVTYLKQHELELYEGKEEQSIESLRPSPATPIEVGFLVDISNSEGGALRALRRLNAADVAGEALRPGDFGFVAAFNQRVSLVCSATTDVEEVAKALREAFSIQPSGVTSLYDAIHWAVSSGAATRASRKVLIVLSDMRDNASNDTREEASVLAQRSGTVIYPIVLGELTPGIERVTRSIADGTGGVYFTPMKLGDLSPAIRNIRTYLDNSYVLQYRPRSPGPVPIKIRCSRKGVKVVAPHHRY